LAGAGLKLTDLPLPTLLCHIPNLLDSPLQISNGIAGYKVENPNASDTDAVQALLPGTKWQMDENGELTMQMDGELLSGWRWRRLVCRSRTRRKLCAEQS
jgi:hypothetical protein